MLSTHGRGFAHFLFHKPAAALAKRGVSPDTVTIIGTIGTCIAALTLFPLGYVAIGPWIVAVVVLFDNLDGQIARITGKTSSWGAFLDSTLDRVSDGAIFVALMFYAALHLDGGEAAAVGITAAACLVSGAVVPYAKARAESLGYRADGGLAERADRLLVVLTATWLHGWFLPAWAYAIVLGLLALASIGTAVYRMVLVYRQTHPQR